MRRATPWMVCALLLTLAASAIASEGWQDELRSRLTAKLTPTKRSFTGTIKAPGTVLVVRKEGLRVDKPKAVMTPTVIRDGKVTEMGGGGFLEGTAGRSLKIGDRLYLYDLRVEDEWIDLIVATVDTIDVTERGSSTSTPYQASVRFEFPGNSLASTSADDVAKTIGVFLQDEAEAAAAPAQTVKLGQTPEEVAAVFGKPDKIIDLGEKVVYVYKDMKVIFRGGKVADVE